VLGRQRIGQPDFAKPLGQILLVQCPGLAQLLLLRRDQVLGQHGHAVLAALAVAHHQFALLEADVLHPQAQRVQQARRGRGTLISCRGLFGIHRRWNVWWIDNRGHCGHKCGLTRSV
jgi:hypothetical protein